MNENKQKIQYHIKKAIYYTESLDYVFLRLSKLINNDKITKLETLLRDMQKTLSELKEEQQ